MIYLLTRPSDDTTTLVIQWLIFLKKDFKRLNSILDIPRIWHSETATVDKQSTLSLCPFQQTDSFYFNGGSLRIPDPGLVDKQLNFEVSRFASGEAGAYLSYLAEKYRANKTFGLNPYSSKAINKLHMLEEAKHAGFLVPETEIVTTKEALRATKAKWGRIINKSIDNGVNIETDDIFIGGQKTIEISDSIIDNMADRFLPSLIQKLVLKKFELRVFFFQGSLKSIALFSQGNESTKVDSRSRTDSYPIREVPFKLPEEVELRIINFMHAIGLNYGSIDLIYTPAGEYCFLEVNPFGQYGFLSSAANYFIEKTVASYL